MSDIVLQIFYPFREKLGTYRGYRLLGDDGLGRYHRSIIISKQRYGVADQVININFFGSVGWWKALPPPDEIKDYSKFRTEYGNIPCKIRNQKDDDEPVDKQTGEIKKPLTYSF